MYGGFAPLDHSLLVQVFHDGSYMVGSSFSETKRAAQF